MHHVYRAVLEAPVLTLSATVNTIRKVEKVAVKELCVYP